MKNPNAGSANVESQKEDNEANLELMLQGRRTVTLGEMKENRELGGKIETVTTHRLDR